jgi:HlyD family type I secretion membrane fusion protein
MNTPLVLHPSTDVIEHDESAAADHSLRRIALLSLLTIVLGFGGLLGWAAVARLDSAVPATGVIVAAGKRKTITVNEGGILAELLVKEGDTVAAGQLLLRLDDVQASAADEQSAAQYWGAMAQATRLHAELDDKRTLQFPETLLRAAANPAIAAEVAAERRMFDARWSGVDTGRQVMIRRIAEQQASLAALHVQLREIGVRMALFDDELAGAKELYSKGYATRLRVNQLERSVSEARGQQADVIGRITFTQQLIAQTQLEMQNTGQTRRTDITRELEATETRLADAEGRLRASRDRLDKRNVRAPEAGTIMDVKFFTPGSNVAAGQPVLDLVPSDPRLLVEGDVAPTDIEHVHVGQKVNVRLTAYKAHQVPVITGHLVYVSADRQMTPQNLPVFKVRAELDEDALKDLPNVAIYAGMPADVLIIGNERTALAYLISPIRDSLRHAMHEE